MKTITACVIRGGGSHGAWGSGLLTNLNKDYDMVFGVSTGSLMAIHVATKQFDALKEAYTTQTTEDIFDVNPINQKGNVKIWNAIKRLVTLKKTLGESHGLKKQIDKFLSKDLFDKSKEKYVSVAVQNITIYPYQIEHKVNQHCSFDDFKDWMWASASFPILGSIIEKNGYEYMDAGVSQVLSLKQAVDQGATEIDVIIHNTKDKIELKSKVNNILHTLFRVLSITRDVVEDKDLTEGLLAAKLNNCIVNIYRMSEPTDLNAAVFDEQKMIELWNKGFNGGFIKETFDFTKLKNKK